MGEGQEVVAEKAISVASVNGSWVLLQNCELGLNLMDEMEDLLIKIRDTAHEEFRLFFTAMPVKAFPLGLLQMCTKVTNEPPAGMRAGLQRSYATIMDQDRLERIDTAQWRKLTHALCFLHSVVQERRKFGPLGWNIPYEFNSGDLMACLMFLEKHLFDNDKLSWSTVQYMVCAVQYGGKITDDMDRRLFRTYADSWIAPSTLMEDFTYNPDSPIARIPDDFVYSVLDRNDIPEYQKYFSSFPEIDSPEIFGLHPNADLTFRVKEVTAMLNTLGDTQPKSGGSADGGPSREEVVSAKAGELLDKLPADFVEEVYNEKLEKLGGKGVPLNIFLFQEVQRLQQVIARMRKLCTDIRLAINGEIVLTQDLVSAMNDMFDSRVPHACVYTPGGDEFSWISPSLGLWFTSLLRRREQNSRWLDAGRPHTFWLSGFFNPQGFLTAMKQEVTRQHKSDKWGLDDVVYHSEVTAFEGPDRVSGPPKEGAYVHGLFLDGAAWDTKVESLVEAEPKKLFEPLPVLYVTAVESADHHHREKELYGSRGPYKCPVYKYTARTDRYLIFMVNLLTKERAPEHWVLRGVALVCAKE